MVAMCVPDDGALKKLARLTVMSQSSVDVGLPKFDDARAVAVTESARSQVTSKRQLVTIAGSAAA